MKSAQVKLMALILIAFSCLAMFLNTIWITYEKLPFTIGTTHFNGQFKMDIDALEKDLSREVRIHYYADENALLAAIYEEQLDAYILNPFNFIEHYKTLNGARAIVALNADYYLVSKLDTDIIPTRVAIFDKHLSALLINQRTMKHVYLTSPTERMAALNDGLVDLIILESEFYDSEKHFINDTVSKKGYNFSLFILSEQWLTEDKGIDFVGNLQTRLLQFSEGHLPDEEKLLRIMNYLFQTESIKKRLDYSELVYIKGL